MYKHELKGRAGKDYSEWIENNLRTFNIYQVPFDDESYMRCMDEWLLENGYKVRVAKNESKGEYIFEIVYTPRNNRDEVFEYQGEPIRSKIDLIRAAYDRVCELYNQKKS